MDETRGGNGRRCQSCTVSAISWAVTEPGLTTWEWKTDKQVLGDLAERADVGTLAVSAHCDEKADHGLPSATEQRTLGVVQELLVVHAA